MAQSTTFAAAAITWRPSALVVRRLAFAAVVVNIGIVATGGLVRLTNSGLGCPDWPDCSGGSLVATGKVSWHKAVENTNRGLTIVVLAAVLAVFVAAYRELPARPAVRRWAWVTLLGVPAQALLGGITVLTHLNPWVVAGHFLLSMLLIAAATVLWWRTREPEAASNAPPPIVRRLGLATWGLTYAVFVVGTLVTGSGPHAGDATAARLHLRPAAISQLHADLVMLLVGTAISLAVCVTAIGGSVVARRATRILVGVLAAQAAIGFAQYFSGLPIGLVELHVTGAAVLAATVSAVVLALHPQGPAQPAVHGLDERGPHKPS
jgi:cytochrome c oxidase assembly protein subunit 15